MAHEGIAPYNWGTSSRIGRRGHLRQAIDVSIAIPLSEEEGICRVLIKCDIICSRLLIRWVLRVIEFSDYYIFLCFVRSKQGAAQSLSIALSIDYNTPNWWTNRAVLFPSPNLSFSHVTTHVITDNGVLETLSRLQSVLPITEPSSALLLWYSPPRAAW